MNTVWQKVKTIWLKTKKWREERKWFLIAVAVLYGLFAIVLVALWGKKGPVAGIIVYWDWLWLAAITGYTLASLNIVDPDKLGLILLWGKPILDTGSGLKLVPIGVCTIEIITKTRIQMELPGEPEQIWRLEDARGNELPTGIGLEGKPVDPPSRIVDDKKIELPWVPPWRITSASPESCLLQVPFPEFIGCKKGKRGQITRALKKYDDAKKLYDEQETTFRVDFKKYQETKDPLHERLTVESLLIVRFRIVDYRQFIQVIETVDEAKRQIKVSVAGRVQNEFARRTPALILAHLDAINQRLLIGVEILVGEREDVLTGEKRDPWGIKVEDVYVKLLGITKSVNEKIAARMGAGFARHQLALEGQGRGEAAKEELAATANGLEAIRKIAAADGGEQAIGVVYGTRIAESVGNLFVTDDKPLTNIMGALAAGKGTLTGQPASRPPKKRRPKTGSGGSPPPATLPSPPPPANP